MGVINVARDLYSRLCESHESFSRTLRTSIPKRELALLAGIVAVVFAGLLTITPHGFPFGDAPLYAAQIAAADLSERTVHFGYFALAIAVTKVVPLDLTFTLNVLNTLFSALCAGLVASIAYTLTGKKLAMLVSAATFLAPAYIVMHSLTAEVYMPQLFFLLLCVQLTLWDRPLTAGLAFGWAILITPSAILAAPTIVLLNPKARFISRWAAAFVALAFLVPVLNFHDYFQGGRSVLTAGGGDLGLGAALSKEAKEVASFSAVSVPVLAGAYVVARSRRHRLLALAFVVMWALTFLFGDRFSDVPAQLPFYAMLAVLSGIGAVGALRWTRASRALQGVTVAALVAALVVTAYPSYSQASAQTEKVDTYRRTIEAASEDSRPGEIMLAPWLVAVLCDYYQGEQGIGVVYGEALSGSYAGQTQAEAEESLSAALDERRRVWLPDPLKPPVPAFESIGYELVPFDAILVAVPR